MKVAVNSPYGEFKLTFGNSKDCIHYGNENAQVEAIISLLKMAVPTNTLDLLTAKLAQVQRDRIIHEKIAQILHQGLEAEVIYDQEGKCIISEVDPDFSLRLDDEEDDDDDSDLNDDTRYESDTK